MQIRIDVQATNGVNLGLGPIMTATDWKFTQRLDRSGDFSFQMPIADPMYSTLVGYAGRALARCWGLVGGVMTQLGLGIIDKVVVNNNANPSMATISGSDLMRELSQRTVKGLRISEVGYSLPEDVHGLDLSSSGSGQEANPNNYTPLPNLFDGNAGTWSDISNVGPYRYFYIGFSRPFSEVKWVLHIVNTTVIGSLTKLQYFNGTAWVNLTFTDGTYTNITMGQNGSWTFTPPADWVPLVQNCVATGGVANNLNEYWLRFDVNPGTYQTVSVSEVTIKTNIATLTGPTLIMALAPAGWTLTGYSTTLTSVYHQFSDETVLEALTILAGIAGEHFILDGFTRAIGWIGKDATGSGVVAFRNGDPAALAANANTCIAADFQVSHDTFDLVSRVIPYGSGVSGARTTLALTTRTAPAGYTLDKVNNFIKRDAVETTYGQVEKVQVWPNIGPATWGQADAIQAANALFDTAIYWLSTHSGANDSYALTVYGLTGFIRPGYTIRVVWLEIVGGIAIQNIDVDLIVLEILRNISQDGTYSVKFLVSTLAYWPLSEEDALAKLMGGQRAMQSIAQPAPVETLRSPTVALTVTRTGSGFGGLNYN